MQKIMINSSLNKEDGINGRHNKDINGQINFHSLPSESYIQYQKEYNQESLKNNNNISNLLIINKSEESQKELEKLQKPKDDSKDKGKNIEKEILPSNNYNVILFEMPNNIKDISSTKDKLQNKVFKNSLEDKRPPGRKRKNDNLKTYHNKYSDDNIRRKCKHIVLNSVMEFINKKIKILYSGNIGNNIFRKEIKTLNKGQTSNSHVEYNKMFLNKTLNNIFSEDISSRFSYLPKNHNKFIIKTLENEKDENKRIYFKNLFKLTFLQCVRHFIGNEFINELDGMKCFNDLKEELKDEQHYDEMIKYYLLNFEEIINKKKSRKSKKIKNVEKTNKDN